MAWFTNGKKIDTRLNGLRDKIHLLEDRIVYLEDRIHKFSNAIYLLQEDIKQSKLTDNVRNPKDSEVLSDKFVESARKLYPITTSHSVWTTLFNRDFVSTSSDSSSCSFD